LEEKNKINSLLSRLREKHKLSFTDDKTYHEKWSFNLSNLNLLSLLFLYSLFIVLIVFLIIQFTPIKRIFVNNQNIYELSETLKKQSEKIQKFEKQMAQQAKYDANLLTILKGGDFNDSLDINTSDIGDNYEPNFSKNKADSLLRYKMETSSKIKPKANPSNIGFFMSPVKGQISQSINKKNKHYGIDIVTSKNEPIKATLEGVVILSNWTSNDGNVIVIQHQNNIISIYKHCSSLLKSIGDVVEVGDPIAIVGNSGKHTDGPHLHFELWQNKILLDPQEFISF